MAANRPLSRVETALRRAGRDLGDLGRRYALVGGLAASARAEPRFTRDADLAVLVSDDRDAEALVAGLRDRGWTLLAAIEQEATGRLAAVRLSPTGESETGVIVDLLFASSGIEGEIVAAAEMLEVLAGLLVPVAQTGHLIALKLLSRDDVTRPQDFGDLRALLPGADDHAIEQARSALRLVVARGFHRGRDLDGDLDRAVRELRVNAQRPASG